MTSLPFRLRCCLPGVSRPALAQPTGTRRLRSGLKPPGFPKSRREIIRWFLAWRFSCLTGKGTHLAEPGAEPGAERGRRLRPHQGSRCCPAGMQVVVVVFRSAKAQSKGAVPPEAFSKTAGGPPRVGRHEEAISLKIERRASKAPL